MTKKRTSQKSQENPPRSTKMEGFSKPKYQLYCWFFSLPMEEISASQLSQFLKEKCKKFSFQGEIGDETGYKHWQGQFSLINKEYFDTVRNMMPRKMHIEATNNIFAVEKYTMKNETRICGPYTEKSTFLEVISENELYHWQKMIENIHLEKPCKRTIYWFWEEEGNIGKTEFIKYMINKYGKEINALSSGKGTDMARIISKNPNAKTCMIFLPRTLEGRINYMMFEEIKDGLLMSGKYDSETIIFNRPHMFVFANFAPETETMSLDRWNIINLRDVHGGSFPAGAGTPSTSTMGSVAAAPS